MSRRVGARVLRLERAARAAGACRLCGGYTVVKVIIGDEEASPPPCRACGREPTVVRIVRAEPPPGWEERQKERRDRAQGA